MTILDIVNILNAWQHDELKALLAELRRAVADEDENAAANFATELRVLAQAKIVAYEKLTEFARSPVAIKT